MSKTFQVLFTPLSQNKIQYRILNTTIWCERMGDFQSVSNILHKDDMVIRWFFRGEELDKLLEDGKSVTIEVPTHEKWKFGYDPCDLFNPDFKRLDWLGKYIKDLESIDLTKKATPSLVKLKRKIRFLLWDSHSAGPTFKNKVWWRLVSISKNIKEELTKRGYYN